MASEALHLPIYFLFFTLLSACIKCNNSRELTNYCASFNCGNGIGIGYPFWLQSQQSEYCGYPGFGISCKGDIPVFNISSHIYNIENFNIPEKIFTVKYDDQVEDPSCPVAARNVVLDTSSLMNYTRDVMMMHFFYNCTLYPPSLPDINCLQYGLMHSYVFMDGAVPEFDWHKYCESIVTVPVMETPAIHHGDLQLVNGFGRALLEGFKLTWKPDLACQSCEATGGSCGHKTSSIDQKFICFCNDGQHPSSCHDSGTVSVSSESNYIATAALIFGGLITASTVLYSIQKKKFGMKKHGFNQIATNGKSAFSEAEIFGR